MTREELEADVAAYERVKATAPAEPTQELRATSIAEVDARAVAAQLEAEGQAEAATARRREADAARVRAAELEGRLEARRRGRRPQLRTQAREHQAEAGL